MCGLYALCFGFYTGVVMDVYILIYIYLLPALLIKLYFDPFPCFSVQSSEEQDRMGTEETVHIRISRRRRSQIWHQWLWSLYLKSA